MLPDKKCTGCGVCAEKCPKNAIVMEKDKSGFLYPSLNPELCVKCGMCEKACPVLNNAVNPEDLPVAAYAAYINEENTRINSSSGGVFSAAAEKVLKDGGVVCGAAFVEDWTVKHIFIEDAENLKLLRGSKYVKSDLGRCLEETKAYLNNGRKVLFSGTPCQVAGLYAYLGCRPANLWTVDIVCHGTPAPKVWEDYIKSYNKPIKYINFRDKSAGWHDFSMRIDFVDGTQYCKDKLTDPYMKAFLNNLDLRDSCYECAFKTKARLSDITIADFWGCEDICPDMDDDKGLSLVFVQSAKGLELLNEVSADMTLRRIALDKAYEHNSAITRSVWKNPNRDLFMKSRSYENLDAVVNRYLHPNLFQRAENKARKLLDI